MQTTDTLKVEFVGDTSDLDRKLKTTKKEVSGFGSVVQGVAMGAGFAIAGFAVEGARSLGVLGAASVDAASDMNETIGKTNILFGDSADQLLAWGDSAATALGQSKQQALDAATTFATFGRAAGITGDDLVEFSTGFTGLATDLASFNNTSPEQAITAIGAALRGESEPLRAYGVLLDDASMRNKALELGIIDNVKNALTPQQKVLAAQALIYEQTSAAQGDFARTSEGLANQQRILDAQFANTKTVIGQGLLPIMVTFAQMMNRITMEFMPPLVAFITDKVVPAMTRLAAFVVVAANAFGKHWPQISAILADAATKIGTETGKILESLNSIGAWFGGEGASTKNDWSDFWLGLLRIVTEMVTGTLQNISSLLQGFAALGDSVQAIGAGDWGKVGANAGSIGGILNNLYKPMLNPVGAMNDVYNTATGQSGWAIVQNFYGPTDPDKVRGASSDGVANALRSIGGH